MALAEIRSKSDGQLSQSSSARPSSTLTIGIAIHPAADAVDHLVRRQELAGDPIAASLGKVAGGDIEAEGEIGSGLESSCGNGIDGQIEELFDRTGRGSETAFVGAQSALAVALRD